MELREIQKHLEEEGFACSFEPATPEAPLDQLYVLLELEDPEVELALELAYVPGLDDELEDIKLLQFFVALPIDVETVQVDRFSHLVLESNLNLPLVGFGLHHEDGYLYFRFVLPLGKAAAESDRPVIVQSAWMVFFLVERFYPILAAEAAGVQPS